MRWASPNSPAVSGNRDGRLRPEAIAEWASAPVLPRVPCKKVPPGCRLSGTVPTASRCKKRPGVSAMPSSAYFRRQADICLRLSLIASDEEVSSRLIKMSREYLAKGDALAGGEADAGRHLPDHDSESPSREIEPDAAGLGQPLQMQASRVDP